MLTACRFYHEDLNPWKSRTYGCYGGACSEQGVSSFERVYSVRSHLQGMDDCCRDVYSTAELHLREGAEQPHMQKCSVLQAEQEGNILGWDFRAICPTRHCKQQPSASVATSMAYGSLQYPARIERSRVLSFHWLQLVIEECSSCLNRL